MKRRVNGSTPEVGSYPRINDAGYYKEKLIKKVYVLFLRLIH